MLLDNCGEALSRSRWLNGCELVVIESDDAAAMRAMQETRGYVRQGTSADMAYPNASIQLAILFADPLRSHLSIETALAGLAEGGVAIVVAPSEVVDGDVGRLAQTFDSTELVGLTRTNVAEGPQAPATDVLVVRRRHQSSWVRELSRQTAGRIIAPGDVLGTMERDRDGVAHVSGMDARTAAERLGTRLRGQLGMAVAHGALADVSDPAGPAIALWRPSPAEMMDYQQADDGSVWTVGAAGTATMSAAAGSRKAAKLLAARELARQTQALIDLERTPGSDDVQVEHAITRLRVLHAQFAAEHGHVLDAATQRDVSTLTRTGYLLQLLEDADSHGNFARDGEVLRERIAYPDPGVPERADGPDMALSISLEQTAGVDLALVAQLLGTDEAGAEAQLGERIVRDPDSGAALYADDYLSGNVGRKLDHVRELIRRVEDEPREAALRAWRDGIGMRSLLEEGYYDVRLAASESDQWRYLTGADQDCAVPVRAWQRRNVGFQSSYQARWHRAFVTMALSAGDGAWDEVANHEANAAVHEFIASSRVRSTTQREALATICACMVSPNVPEDVTRHLLERLSQTREGKQAMRLAHELVGRAWPMGADRQADSTYEIMVTRPEALEYLAMAEARRGITEGFAQFCERRASALDVDIDEGRLEELRRLEARLAGACPTPLEQKDIVARLGSPWIPASIYLQFAIEHLCKDDATANQLMDLAVTTGEDGSWVLRSTDVLTSMLAAERYAIRGAGANAASPFRLMSNAMTGTPTTITRPEPNDDGDGYHLVVDEEMTLLAAEKRSDLEDAFVQWLWSDPRRSEMLVERYNEVLNRQVGRHFDGSYLTLPDSADDVELAPHQKDAVARALRSPEGTLLAHAVGAGKTFEGIAIAHESKRLGACTKPLVAVPNSVVSQWAREWARLYPLDRVLVMDGAVARSPETRRRFWDVARMGTWDAVVVPHSQFDTMRLSPAWQERVLSQQLAELEHRYRTDDGPAITRRRRQSSLATAIRKHRKALEAVDHGSGAPCFDLMGFDMLVVDEAHQYKHLGIAGAMRVSGVDGQSSKRAANLMTLCDYLRDQGHANGIVFMTGTPLTNSVCELYVMQQYLAPRALRELGIPSFADWAATFGKTVREIEIKPEGGLQTKERFSRFCNLPELMANVHGWCDLVTNDDLMLDLPDVKVVNVEVPPTASQRMCMRWLEGRGEAVRHDRVSATVDNMLVITSDGKKVALDPKLLFPDDDAVPPMEGGKVDRCARTVREVWERTTASPTGEDVRGVQLVFCDTSTDNGAAWNVQRDLRRRLVELGIPKREVVTVPGSLSAAARERIFAQARTGEVRVLIGSTQTLGTGVSVQQRLAAIHDLDCPWRSSDLEQRMGRIRRQGNGFFDCDWYQPTCYRYATAGTFDAYLYQTTARKGSFVSQVMSNDSPLREAAELSDIVLTLTEMKALASGNPAVRRRFELESDVKSLQMKRSAWSREIDAVKKRLEEEVNPLVAELRTMVEGNAPLLGCVQAVLAQKGEREGPWMPITVDGTTYAPTEEGLASANRALEAATSHVPMGTDRLDLAQVGDVRVGVTWKAEVRDGMPVKRLAISCDGGSVIRSGEYLRLTSKSRPHADGPVNQAFELLGVAPATIRRTTRRLARYEGERADMERRIATPWAYEGELIRKKNELDALPVAEEESLSAARQYPHVSDVYRALTTGEVVELGRARAEALPEQGMRPVIEVEDYEVR